MMQGFGGEQVVVKWPLGLACINDDDCAINIHFVHDYIYIYTCIYIYRYDNPKQKRFNSPLGLCFRFPGHP